MRLCWNAEYTVVRLLNSMSRADPAGAGGRTNPGKSQVAKGFLRNSGADLPRGPIASQRRSELPLVKYMYVFSYLKQKEKNPPPYYDGSLWICAYM